MKRCDFITLLGGAAGGAPPIRRCAGEDAIGAVDRHEDSGF
jgi:hypothetical protein